MLGPTDWRISGQTSLAASACEIGDEILSGGTRSLNEGGPPESILANHRSRLGVKIATGPYQSSSRPGPRTLSKGLTRPTGISLPAICPTGPLHPISPKPGKPPQIGWSVGRQLESRNNLM